MKTLKKIEVVLGLLSAIANLFLVPLAIRNENRAVAAEKLALAAKERAKREEARANRAEDWAVAAVA